MCRSRQRNITAKTMGALQDCPNACGACGTRGYLLLSPQSPQRPHWWMWMQGYTHCPQGFPVLICMLYCSVADPFQVTRSKIKLLINMMRNFKMAAREHETKSGLSLSLQRGVGGGGAGRAGGCATWQISCQEVNSALAQFLVQSTIIYGQQTLFPFSFPPVLVLTRFRTQTCRGRL